MLKGISNIRKLYFLAIILGIMAAGLGLNLILPVFIFKIWLVIGIPMIMTGLAMVGIQTASVQKYIEDDWGEQTLAILFAIGLMAEALVWHWMVPLILFLFFGIWALVWMFWPEKDDPS